MRKIAIAVSVLLLVLTMAQADPPGSQPALSFKPAEKNGLSIQAILTKAAFAANEPLKFTVQFKNVSDKPFLLFDAAYYWKWIIHFEDQRKIGPWRVERLFDDLRSYENVVTTLKPGDTLDVLVELDRNRQDRPHEFVWGGVQKQPLPPVKALPVARYQLTVEINLKADPGPRQVPFWTGTLATNPVEFEITDKPTPPASQLAPTDPAPLTLKDRITTRTFPSVFQAWNPADNLKGEDRWTTVARHDLVFHCPEFLGLKWDGQFIGLSSGFVKETLPTARKLRADMLRKNPNAVMLAEIRYRDAHRSYLPEDHAWWKRKDGKLVMGWDEGGYIQLDFANPDFRRQVAVQAKAVVDSGAFDGVMLDWWGDDEDRLALIKEVRAAVGEKALILANANDRKTPKTAAFINGYFMECYKSKTAEDWRQIADTLQWAEKNLREPRINCLETWFHSSRRDLNLMRATTTLTLTLSDGYCLFSDPNPLPTPDHLHDWYDFWDRSLGRPAAKVVSREDGAFQREFEKGVVVYNPMGNRPITVKFADPRRQASTGESGRSFVVPACDGDLFLPLGGK
jgi:hypothetical protein